MQNHSTNLCSNALEQLINDVRIKGYSVQDHLFDAALINGLEEEALSLSSEQLHCAGIGRKQDFHLASDVRKDRICWLDNKTPTTTSFLSSIEELKTCINRQLLLGLFDYEAHFAEYSAGGFYEKHLDAFKGKSNRVLSTVLYLNTGWNTEDGGELVLYDEQNTEQEIALIQPIKGRFLVFLSECFYHKVNPANRTRHSIAGWFRVNNSLSNTIDPHS